MSSKILLPVAIGFILLCTGCFVFGSNKDYHPFDPALLDSVQAGKTTAAEISERFGAPTSTVELSNGNAYVYHRSVSKATVISLVVVSFANYDAQADKIVFFFDKNDLLTHFGSSLNTDQAVYGLPF